jgi:hypothetical protein
MGIGTNSVYTNKPMRIGSAAAPTATLDVTGTAAISGGLTVASYLRSTSTATTNYIAGSMVLGESSFPVASAVVEMKSTTKGLLTPRMTEAQRAAIASPATGLTLYCTDCIANDASTGVMCTYNGTVWKNNW